MSTKPGRPRLTFSQELHQFITRPVWSWKDATDAVKRGYLLIISVFGMILGLGALLYANWLDGRVACAASFYQDERIYRYGPAGYVMLFVFSLLGLLTMILRAEGSHSTAPPALQGRWVWVWQALIVCGLLAATFIVYGLLRMCW